MAALALVLATPATAAEQGMPQLDFSTYPSQLFWLAVFFFALYMVISRVALPRIGGMIEERRTRIASDLDRAQELKDDTERAIATYESELAEARSKAHAIVQHKREEMTAELDAERADLDEEIAARLARAEKAIASTRDKALGKVERMAADVAGEIVAQLAGIKVSRDEVARAVSRAGGK
jgi:F-type H+-transporting ATPase subunit b